MLLVASLTINFSDLSPSHLEHLQIVLNSSLSSMPKPYKDNIIPVHELLKCKICKTMWNRDVNSATNIYKIAKNAILQKPRPKYLCRDKKKIIMKVIIKKQNLQKKR